MAGNVIPLTTPLRDEDTERLRCGDRVMINGTIYTARDAAHRRIVEALDCGDPLPLEIEGQVIYFAGPSPAREGRPVGSIGPTTSYRMDAYSPRLIALGLKGMIGKGGRSEEVIEALRQHKAVYFGATGGAGALLARAVKRVEVIAYEELGPEAVRRLEVEDFPVVVINDCHGGDLYETGRSTYRS